MSDNTERTILGLLRLVGWQSGRDRELTEEEAELILEVAATQPVSDDDHARLRDRVLNRLPESPALSEGEPTQKMLDGLKEARDRLGRFVRSNVFGGCRVLSQGWPLGGIGCTCPLCDMERLTGGVDEARRIGRAEGYSMAAKDAIQYGHASQEFIDHQKLCELSAKLCDSQAEIQRLKAEVRGMDL